MKFLSNMYLRLQRNIVTLKYPFFNSAFFLQVANKKSPDKLTLVRCCVVYERSVSYYLLSCCFSHKFHYLSCQTVCTIVFSKVTHFCLLLKSPFFKTINKLIEIEICLENNCLKSRKCVGNMNERDDAPRRHFSIVLLQCSGEVR